MTDQAIKISNKAKEDKLKLKEECFNLKEMVLTQKTEANELRNDLRVMNQKYTTLLEDVNKNKTNTKYKNNVQPIVEDDCDLEESLSSDTKFINISNTLANSTQNIPSSTRILNNRPQSRNTFMDMAN